LTVERDRDYLALGAFPGSWLPGEDRWEAEPPPSRGTEARGRADGGVEESSVAGEPASVVRRCSRQHSQRNGERRRRAGSSKQQAGDDGVAGGVAPRTSRRNEQRHGQEGFARSSAVLCSSWASHVG
jgi:hypothetical protein